MDDKFDTLIRGGLVFDGLGNEPRVADVGVRDGNVVAIAADLPVDAATEVVEARGRWVTPGFIDLHTHYDAELEVTPEIFESVRHGVTTVVTGSCSLSMAVGDPVELADMFCRVEAIPRRVVKPLLEEKKDWDDPAGYIEHLAARPLGPNVACMLGHSTIRAAAMGMGRALDKDVTPTVAEMTQMEQWLEQSLDAGYLGLSISTLPWDKMDGEEFRSRPMPSVFARWKEYRRFAKMLRERGRVLQAIPNVSTKINFLLFPLLSAGFWRKTLKTTLISMMDIRADRFAFRIAGWLCRLANRLLGADLRMQALPEEFDLWADGVDLVVFEEFEAGTSALHVQDQLKRSELLRDPEYRERFKKQWRRKFVPKAYHRDLARAEILECPDRSVVGRTFAEIAEERGVDPVDAFLDLAADHGAALRWYTVMGNDRPDWLQRIISHPDVLIGFSDAGAHLRNMAHYNFPLRMLKLVRDAQQRGEPFMTTERAVQRLTSEIGHWLDIDAGVLAVGKRADIVVIDPEELTDELAVVHEEEMLGFGLKRLVRRNDGAVPAVLIGGRVASRGGTKAPDLGRMTGFGQVLRAGTETLGLPTVRDLRAAV